MFCNNNTIKIYKNNNYKRNHIKQDISIIIWRNSILEGIKNLLANCILLGSTALIHSNKFNAVSNNINRNSELIDDKYILYSFVDGFRFTKTVKSKER